MKRLEEIRSRLKAATPGPWYANFSCRDVRQEKTRTGICSVSDVDRLRNDGTQNPIDPWADAEMIAHAPADLALLVECCEEMLHALLYCSEFDPYAIKPDDSYDFASAEDWKMMRAREALGMVKEMLG